jgi:hypothetical protein
MLTHEYERSQRFLLLLSIRNTAVTAIHRGTATRYSVAKSIRRLHRAQYFLDAILQKVCENASFSLGGARLRADCFASER